ncbi:Carboxy-terminal processing protease CtpB [BD1-7 clade bacterium]|uniref:Carboxy-terminal processing protease CtpB n=1 Tax=BD1-7 clade bacterium TaxID=2029982 RepID=A0A5S9MXQ7_9GAMM|nr:Carboxy-terminal processing protease CtpB [BD1-7 clade bacterium]
MLTPPQARHNQPSLFRTFWLVLALPILLSLAFEANARTEPQTEATTIPLDDLRTFVDVYHQIRGNYVAEVSDEQLLEYAIKGMLEGLDPHSSYLNKDEFDNLKESTRGEFAGVGLEVTMEDKLIKVIAPIDDTPASRAGFKTGDIIIKIDHQALKDLNLGEALELMRGPSGSTMTLSVVREGERKPFDIVLTREIIRIQSVKSRLLGDDYGYLRISQFQEKTGRETGKHLRELTRKAGQPLKGVVIDLRNNPGGLLSSAIDVADAFLDDGLITYTRGRVSSVEESYYATPKTVIGNQPIIILMNSGSASSSEIVAGALQDHQRALIVGTTSFGKGSVQSILPLSEDRAIKLTTARYFTPNGRSIQAEGIQPDIEIKPATITPDEESFSITEADLSGHLDGNKNKVAVAETEDLKIEDFQLYEALNILKAISLTQGHVPENTISWK